ncbi:unnamed protein product [Spirodela intermedia]|uniref:Poly [ADP-ribose] polymerase n=1 Tax=Spirodela intermedia TaxID=51605 RepID=A0A7I8IZM9_SPIIN|nr:unnamed protein product [Spirodela intermedia]CAA6662611.1 unnamed protein product [Spirodela intermedia]
MVQAVQFDGFMPLWNHASCIFKKANQIKSIEDVEGVDLLRWEDQQKIRTYVEGGDQERTAVAEKESAIEISPSSRAACRKCNDKIIKGTVRVSTKPDGQGAKGLMYYHKKCFIDMFPSFQPEKLSGWNNLPIHDKDEVSVLADNLEATNKRGKGGLQQVASEGTKRRRAVNDDNESKISKTEERIAPRGAASRSRAGALEQLESSSSNFESRLEQQSNALWAIKDELKRHVSSAELREMLEANEQDSAGQNTIYGNDGNFVSSLPFWFTISNCLLFRSSVDGMLFGALAKCPLCSGSLYYSSGQYYCHGYISAWSKCSYSTAQPVRLKAKWKVPEETSNQYLVKWFRTQKVKKPERLLPQSSKKASMDQFADRSSEKSNVEGLRSLKVALTGKLKDTMEDWKKKLASVGGDVLSKISKGTNCLVVSEEVDDSDPEIRKARRMKIPIVREDYLTDCISKQRKLPFDAYKVELGSETLKSGTLTVKVKGRSAVHESSGLQDTGHILEDGKSIYNTTLNMSDLSTGINRYPHWWKKIEQMSKSEAIDEFKRLFLEKTGNSWETWEQKHNFMKQPGRFFPLDIDYGVKQAPKRKDPNNTKSLLAPQLVALMKMLFDIETYRAAMMEFEINMSEMPLGKLSKENIQKGFEALTEIQNLLTNSENFETSIMKSMIIDASNRFFTLIPSIHPRAIMDLEDFQAKVKMLEALQDIEIAARLVGFDTEDGESLDDKYKKLHCNIAPLDHDSEDYKLVEKYLLNTTLPRTKYESLEDWKLELEDVFALDREGECDRYTSFRDKLQNKMLLLPGDKFCGYPQSRAENCTPEAPATGYMFGKGIYFADLVSKSAQYCFVDRKNPVGLLLLSEVALGEIYELKKASYMERPPEGKNSTKGLGKTTPEKSEFVHPSSVRASELLYNEYIVYDTAQVKMQFLVKVRFHHKR